MSTDARYRAKVWLETYLTDANITLDDNATEAYYIVVFGWPSYPFEKVFDYPKFVDAVISCGDPVSTAAYNADRSIDHYEETTPLTISIANRDGLTATKLKWKIEHEIRVCCETQPFGSIRLMDTRRESTKQVGSFIIYSFEFQLDYKRDTT